MQYYANNAMQICNKQIKNSPKTVKTSQKRMGDISIYRAEILRDTTEYSKGKYCTVYLPSLEQLNYKSQKYITAVANELKAFLPVQGDILVVGLGNPYVTADALGPKALTGILVTRHIKQIYIAKGLTVRTVAAFMPGVQAASGISTCEIVQSVCNMLKPTAVICIDSLCTTVARRLGCTVQISSTGVIAGGTEQINSDLLKIPVIGIGVPTVVKVKNRPNLTLTPKEIDIIVRRGAGLVAQSINLALQPELSLEEICILTG